MKLKNVELEKSSISMKMTELTIYAKPFLRDKIIEFFFNDINEINEIDENK